MLYAETAQKELRRSLSAKAEPPRPRGSETPHRTAGLGARQGRAASPERSFGLQLEPRERFQDVALKQNEVLLRN